MKNKIVWPFLVFSLFFINLSIAQNLEDYLSAYTGDNGKGYVKPLADAFGANINSGFYHDADIPFAGVNIYVGVVTMTAFVSDDSKTFDAKTGEFFLPETTVKVPTIFGDTEGTTVDGNAGTSYKFPGGLGISKLPIAVPQITVGSFMGTDATLRYIQLDVDDNIGELSVFGFGVRHSISQYIPLFPLNIAGGLYYQTFDVGDIIEANAFALSVQGSYSLPFFTFYGGLSYETASLDIKYEFGSGEDTEEISFSLDAENNVRLTLGAAVQLSVFTLHADYNIGNQDVFVLGLGFEF